MYSHGRVAEYWASDFFGIYGADQPDPAVGGPLLRSCPMFGGLGQHDSEGSHGMLGSITNPNTSWSPSRSYGGWRSSRSSKNRREPLWFTTPST